MRFETAGRDVLLLTCEHAGNRIPREYAGLFEGAEEVLGSHRGWDPGAFELARYMSRVLGRPLLEAKWSRLLVEANRSLSNPRIWSKFTRSLPRVEREKILEEYWWPHRRAVEGAVEEIIAGGGRVIHVGVHSFTPVLDGEVRNADMALLYDSRRKEEAAFCRRWLGVLGELGPELRLRVNYPYLGRADGLTTALRRKHRESSYLGIELEMNQAMYGGAGWRQFRRWVAESLGVMLADGAGDSR